MPSLPREVHEVLEHEYVSMYGPLPRVETAYTAEQVLDLELAVHLFRECGVLDEGLTAAGVAAKLNEFLAKLPPRLIDSPALSNNGRLLLERYAEFAEIAKAEDSLRELHRRIVDDALSGAVQPLSNLRLANVYDALHQRAKDPAKARTALCISGGGIRSATFALGVIQGLASAKVLDKFDYLSTVSGGGYIGSWLSSWARRHPQGISGVQKDLADADTASGGRPQRAQKIEPEPEPLRHLRDYSNYLSPRMGLLSGDSWTMGALYSRNLLLNLLVLVPVLAAVLTVPRAYAWAQRATLFLTEWTYPVGTVLFIAIAFAFIGQNRPVDYEDPRQQRTTDGSFILWCILPLMLAAVSLTLFWTDVANDADELQNPWLLVPFVAAVLSMTVLPWILYHRRFRKANDNAPTTTYAHQEKLKEHLREKALWEFFGALLGMGTAMALIVLLAVKVFDRPLQGFTEMIQEATTTAPALRVVSTTPWSSLYTVFAVPAVLLVFFVQASIFVGISSKRNEDYDREWWGRAGAWLLVAAAAWAAVSGIAVFGPIAIYNAPILLGSIGGFAGLAAAAVGYSAKTPANRKEKEDAGTTGKLGNAALGLSVPLFVLFFLSVISLGTTWLTQELRPLYSSTAPINYSQYKLDAALASQAKRVAADPKRGVEVVSESEPAALLSLPQLRSLHHLDTLYYTTGREIAAMLLLAIFAFLLSYGIGVNKFSMHALYRNRLIRAYLGASRYNRQPNPFTGFDERDNLRMYQLRPELLWPSNLKNPETFFRALKEGERITQTNLTGKGLERRKLAQYLWARLYEKTRVHLRNGVTVTAIDAVMNNVNAILLDERRLLENEVVLPKDFWTRTGHDEIPYSAAVRNRAVFDYFFDDVITPMQRRGPLHVVNMALNMVSGEKLAWQQRKAETFTSSPYHTGNVFLGYRDSRVYGGREGISLGTTVTISGAAASPNMGYHSSPALAFLLTLFNIRLGSWLGNPGPAGQKAYPQGHPNSNLAPMLYEAVGRTNDTYDWIYLSDGGHFENLGLYEMVLRRCHYIVLSDGGADPKCSFEDLANAIRKIRTDFGVPIDIGETYMLPRSANSLEREGRYVATATIRYSAVDGPTAQDGVLIYLKPGCYNDEFFPRDVYNYALESPEFPHEPTSDQFFSESQFESYRALGRHAINEICGNYPPKGSEHRIPITKEFDGIPQLAQFILDKHKNELQELPPAQLIASAIRRLAT